MLAFRSTVLGGFAATLASLGLHGVAYASGPSISAPSTPPSQSKSKGQATLSEAEPCPQPKGPLRKVSRSEVYKNTPFKAGETSTYSLLYSSAKVHVGYGIMKVMPPLKYPVSVRSNGKISKKKLYHRVFHAEAYTGDWYKLIFAGHDKMQAISRPQDFGISKFYIQQNEKKPFGRPTQKEKWLDFNHTDCRVSVKEKDHTRNRERQESYYFNPSAVDVYGALFKLRTLSYKLGTPEGFMIYTSEQNWMLKAVPLAEETIKVPAGTFKTYKINLETYIGKDLEQKGKFHIWIAKDHPNRPLVKVLAEVAFGTAIMHLEKFQPGS